MFDQRVDVAEFRTRMDERDVDQAGLGAVRHGLPVMHAKGTRPHGHRPGLVTDVRRFDRPPGLQIDALRPTHLAQFVG